VVEEASVVKRPVLVVRRSTERPEVLGTFATLTDAEGLVARAAPVLDDLAVEHRRLAGIASPYGDGDASGRSVAAIDRRLGT
jgi:UDP-N-acetylglucosamine 2-epimerase (non-hydrolysing)